MTAQGMEVYRVLPIVEAELGCDLPKLTGVCATVATRREEAAEQQRPCPQAAGTAFPGCGAKRHPFL